MELSKRLSAVAHMVSTGNRVADVGCDHGFVSIYLAERKIAPKIIAMDVNEGPLSRAEEHIQEAKLSSYIETRLSDGLKELEFGEADTIIMAGMGGRLMVRILVESLEKVTHVKELVLQPQSEIAAARRYLMEMGFVIDKEDMVEEEGKYYQIFHAVPKMLSQKDEGLSKEESGEEVKTPKISQMEQEIYELYGAYLISVKHSVLKEYLTKERSKYEALLRSFSGAKTPGQKRRRREIAGILHRIHKAQAMIR